MKARGPYEQLGEELEKRMAVPEPRRPYAIGNLTTIGIEQTRMAQAQRECPELGPYYLVVRMRDDAESEIAIRTALRKMLGKQPLE